MSKKYAFKRSYTVECGNRLRVGVRAKNAVACRGLRVGPSKKGMLIFTKLGSALGRDSVSLQIVFCNDPFSQDPTSEFLTKGPVIRTLGGGRGLKQGF